MACANTSLDDSRYCTPCMSEEVSKHSDIYCMDCEEYFCQDCFKFHMKEPTLAKHTILKDDDIDIWRGAPYKCTKHGQRFDYFCVGHSDLCCQVCVSHQHKHCGRLNYIPEVCQKQKLETTRLHGDITETLFEISFEEKTLQENVELNDKSKSDSECQVTEFRQKMNSWLDKLETHARVSIKENYVSNKKSLEDMGVNLQGMKDQLVNIEKRLTSEITGKQNLAYIGSKLEQKEVDKLKLTWYGMKRKLPEMRYKFAVDPSLEKCVRNINELGQIEENTYRSVLLSSERVDTKEKTNLSNHGPRPARILSRNQRRM